MKYRRLTVQQGVTGDADVIAMYQTVSGRTHVTIARTVFTVSGTVRDGTSNGIMPGIAVSAADKAATTDSSGRYALPGIVAGSVTVSASATGYQPASKNVSVSAVTIADLILARMASPPGPSPTPSPTPTPAPIPTPPPKLEHLARCRRRFLHRAARRRPSAMTARIAARRTALAPPLRMVE